jgi:TM2 domain-containing membrane protein YozV
MCGARVDVPSVGPASPPPVVHAPVSLSPPSSYMPSEIEPMTGRPYSERSKVVAGVLQLLLGGLGVGRFYSGHAGIAIAQILVTFLTCGLGVIWPIIDGIMMLAGNPLDGDGRPMRG